MIKSQKLQKRLVPLDIIFSTERIADSDSKYHAELSGWQDVPIINLEPFFSALRAVSGENESLDQFLDFERKRIHPRRFGRDDTVANLRRELSPWNRLLRRKYPVIAKLERDRLVLERGNLLCAIAKYKGKSWIPVLMPPRVASRWDARPTM